MRPKVESRSLGPGLKWSTRFIRPTKLFSFCLLQDAGHVQVVQDTIQFVTKNIAKLYITFLKKKS